MSLDLELFVEQAAWLGPKLNDSSRLGVITWVGRRLEPEARRQFAHKFPLTHPVQRDAELAVCGLLARALVTHPERLRAVSSVTRTVDWAATYANAHGRGRPPMPFLARVRNPIPDRACLGALATIARAWSRLLEFDSAGARSAIDDDLDLRSARLRRAVPPQLARGLASVAFDNRHAIRLRNLDGEAAAQVERIEEAFGFWNRLFGAHNSSDSDALAALGRSLEEVDARNIDTLMEATVALSIARAGTQAERQDWATAHPWSLVAVDDPRSTYPVIRLRSGKLVCEISKGTPLETRADGSRRRIGDLLSPWADEALPPTGKARSSGRQPDVVVTFWLDSDPANVVFVLGDAKRNVTGDGESYLRASLEVAATYLMSFGYRMGLRLPGSDGGAIATALTPGVTIFCRQGTGRDASSAIRILRTDAAAATVMAFDLENHLSPGMRPWHAPVLAAWLGSLGRQAVRVLARTDQGARRRAKADEGA